MASHRRTCATMPHHFHLVATDAAYVLRRRRIEGLTRVARVAARERPVRIAVVVHVVATDDASDLSDAQVHSQLDVLNEDFGFRHADRDAVPYPFRGEAGDARVEFALAHR